MRLLAVTILFALLGQAIIAASAFANQTESSPRVPKTDTDESPDIPEEAETEPVYETVVSGQRPQEFSMDSTVPVDVIRFENMTNDTALSIDAAAATLPGVGLNAPAGLLYTNPSIRGLGGRRIVMLRNNRRVDSGKTIGVSGYFLGLENTERIEVTRGPGSVLYGSDAVGGVINALSFNPLLHRGAEGGYRLVFGINNEALTNSVYGGYGTDRYGLRVHGMIRRAEDYRTGEDQIIENSYYEDNSLGGSASFKPTADREIFLTTDAYWGSGGRAVNALDEEKRRRIYFPSDDNFLLDIGSRRRFHQGNIRSTEMAAYFDRTARHLRRDLYTTDYGRVTSQMDQKSSFYTVGVRPVASVSPFADNELRVGLDVRFQHLTMDQTITTFLPGDTSPPPSKSRPYDGARRLDSGLYVEDDHSFGEHVTLSSGVRGDIVRQWYPVENAVNETQEGAVSGNLGVNYHPVTGLALTLNGGRAFRAPTMEEKFVEFAYCKGVVCGNSIVTPEHSWNIDAGLKGYRGIFTFETYFFTIFIEDYIALTDSTEAHCDYVYINLPRARLMGGEARFIVDIDRIIGQTGLKIWTQVAYTHGEDLESGSPLAQIAPLKEITGIRILGGRYRNIRSPYVEATAVYSAPQYRISEAGNVASQAETVTGAYFTADVSAGLGIDQVPDKLRLDLALQIQNIADTAYRDHLSTVPAMGRNFLLNVAVRY